MKNKTDTHTALKKLGQNHQSLQEMEVEYLKPLALPDQPSQVYLVDGASPYKTMGQIPSLQKGLNFM